MRLIDVRADIPNAFDYVLGIDARLLQIVGAEIILEDFRKHLRVFVDATRAEFPAHDVVDCRFHRRIVGRTLRLDQIFRLIAQTNRMLRKWANLSAVAHASEKSRAIRLRCGEFEAKHFAVCLTNFGSPSKTGGLIEPWI